MVWCGDDSAHCHGKYASHPYSERIAVRRVKLSFFQLQSSLFRSPLLLVHHCSSPGARAARRRSQPLRALRARQRHGHRVRQHAMGERGYARPVLAGGWVERADEFARKAIMMEHVFVLDTVCC